MGRTSGLADYRGDADPIVDVRHVAKSYGPRTALADVSFTIGKGDVVGVLGPNGAGKSTLFRLLLGLTQPDSGEIRVAGYKSGASTASVARSIGFVPQESLFDYRATPREELYFQGRLFGLSRRAAKARAEELLARADLGSLADAKIITLSGGNRRRLDLAMAQLHSPELIILDEPTQGLDVASRIRIWDTLGGLAAQGVTVLFSTHDMAEAEQNARRLLIVQGGKLIADDTTEAICASHRADILILVFEDTPSVQFREIARFHANGEPWVADRQLFVPMEDAQRYGLIAAEAIRAAGANITEFQIKRQSLEAAYLSIAKARLDRPIAPVRHAA